MFKKSHTLSTYIGKKFFFTFCAVFLTLLAVVYMFDTIELIRRAGKVEAEVSMSVIFKMSWFKLPDVGQTLFSFAILFSSMITFWKLTRNHELIVARSFGLSVWQILSPVIMVTLVIGLLRVGMVQHFGAVMLKQYNHLQGDHLGKPRSKIRISSSGLWFKDSDDSYNWIVNADAISVDSLRGVKVFYFDDSHNFIKRLDSEVAVLEEGKIRLENVWENYSDSSDSLFFETKFMSSKIEASDLEEIMIDDPQISVWNMPHYIHIVKNSGLDSNKIETNFFALLFQPILFIALVLLGVSFSLSSPRKGGVAKVIGIGICISFAVFFLNEVVIALGVGGKIATYIAPSIPAMIALLAGISILIKKEDG
jgi:lipopolysaccharide export system permease protein